MRLFIGVTGLEPMTSPSRTARSTKLSYTPNNNNYTFYNNKIAENTMGVLCFEVPRPRRLSLGTYADYQPKQVGKGIVGIGL